MSIIQHKRQQKSFFQKVVAPSGILKHKTIIMPFTKAGTPLHEAPEQYHGNVIAFNGDTEMWQQVNSYDDAAVIDNPPFSLSTKIEQFYINEKTPFILFRSAVSYPLFIYREEQAGVIYENSRRGVQFDWGFAEHIANDKYIHSHYPNLIDNLKGKGVLSKSVPVGFSFYLVDYQFKVKTVTFDELIYPRKKEMSVFLNNGVFDENTKVFIGAQDKRVHAISD